MGRADGPPVIELRSLLSAQAEHVWSRVTDFRGINAELMPWLRMTAPREWTTLTPDRIRPGETLFRSWLLLLGAVPIDYDDVCIVEVGPGHRFLERSRMMSSSMWEHERVVEEASPDACWVIDRVRFTPRWRLLGPILRWFVPRLFAHRHRRLRRAYSGTRRER